MATTKLKGTSKKIKELKGVKPEKVKSEELEKIQSVVGKINNLYVCRRFFLFCFVVCFFFLLFFDMESNEKIFVLNPYVLEKKINDASMN